tara:strand:+ start:1160 stop:2701 length:1542 start_codon:yes stop_codon:yes gene_type:complete
MAERIVKFRPNSINVDKPPAEVAENEYTSGQNIQFRNGYGRKSLGWEQIWPDVPADPQYLINAETGITNYWVACCDTGIYYTDTNTWFDITPSNWVAPEKSNDWTGGILNGIAVFNNGQSTPWFWDPSNPGNIAAMVPGWPTGYTCKAIRPHKFHLVAMNIDTGANVLEDQILWSSAAAPGSIPDSWTPLATNDAGGLQLSATSGEIVDGHTLRGQFYIYKNKSMYRIQYVGGTFVFTLDKVFSQAGMLARNCAVEYNGKAYVLSDSDIIVHDGQNIQSLVDRRAKNFIWPQLDPVNFVNCHVAQDKLNNELLFCLVAVGETVPSVALVYETVGGNIGVRDLGNADHVVSGIVSETGASESWDSDPEPWDSDVTIWNEVTFNPSSAGVLVADGAAKKVRFLDAAQNQDGEPVVMRIEKAYFDLGEPTMVKTITRIWPRVTASDEAKITVRAGAAMTPQNAIEWSAPVTYFANSDHYVDTFATGRQLAVDVVSENGQAFQIEGFDVQVIKAGEY